MDTGLVTDYRKWWTIVNVLDMIFRLTFESHVFYARYLVRYLKKNSEFFVLLVTEMNIHLADLSSDSTVIYHAVVTGGVLWTSYLSRQA